MNAQSLETTNDQSMVTTPSKLLEMAVSQNADIDKLEKLMDLQQRWEANEARKAYIEAMTTFRSSVENITKNKEGHNSKYADLAHTLNSIKNQLSENGLSHTWKTEQGESLAITVTCHVTHRLGHQESTSMTALADTTGSKNDVQAIGSTVTYLQRYTLYAILGLASSDQDNDGKADQRTGAQVDAEWMERVSVWKEILPSILQLKENLAMNEIGSAVEVWFELTDDEKQAVWNPAPSKGGILSTTERTIMKSNEWSEARNAMGDE